MVSDNTSQKGRLKRSVSNNTSQMGRPRYYVLWDALPGTLYLGRFTWDAFLAIERSDATRGSPSTQGGCTTVGAASSRRGVLDGCPVVRRGGHGLVGGRQRRCEAPPPAPPSPPPTHPLPP